MKRQLAWLLFLACLAPAVACNLPVGPDPAVERSVDRTLAALTSQAPQAVYTLEASPPALTPLPNPAGIPPVITSSPPVVQEGGFFRYHTRPGDTLKVLALRFGVEPEEILDPVQYSPAVMLPPDIELEIPNVFGPVKTYPLLLPDGEVVYSPAAAGFSIEETIRAAGGFLSTYSEDVDGEALSGAQIVERAALETSINPRLLLAFLEYRSGWVTGSPLSLGQVDYPIGFFAGGYRGLYKELLLTARQLTIGYYGWRSGTLTDLDFAGGQHLRIDPQVNPGTAALEYLFSKLYNPADWSVELYEPGQFTTFYSAMFGDAWGRAARTEPPIFLGLSQPSLELPFQRGETWTLTGGPHPAWGVGSTWGGLDFAPADVEIGCTVTRYWATAAAGGLVTRSEYGVVAVDLDGDGFEGSGWVLVYLHMATAERVAVGTTIPLDGRIGHPSCEGGVATGTHLHLARKYNGEWVNAEWPLPFILSGWQAWMGEKPYSGSLTRGDNIVTSRLDGTTTSLITR